MNWAITWFGIPSGAIMLALLTVFLIIVIMVSRKSAERKFQEQMDAPAMEPPVTPAAPTGISEEIIAAITAAITASLIEEPVYTKSSFTVSQIVRKADGAAWSNAGIRESMQSI